ncbi:hypothetical protein [Pseudomonas fontis]|uniref:HDOD domain-containing protein n=1 Tax=Pseudomonas fontis TaxID=2942633 RepID=A0ABT5NZ86_9PSED|nr:hypothetical protein [Pseudomonas fontis]MDD0977585.1 hypothetical protein [Pseudomonas fontis]MDD0993437.1 hypothetical protein [Pseudomonas fontis]
MKSTLKARLENRLRKVKDWSSDDFPQQTENLNEYLANQGEVGLACNDLFTLGMTEVKRSLALSQMAQRTPATQHLSSGFARLIVAEAISIAILKNSKRFSVGNLDDATHLMLGAIATGRPSLVKPFYDTVLTAMQEGYGIRDGRDLPIGTTLRYAAFGLTIISRWLERPLDLDKHALPRDPAWGQLVAYWNEPALDNLLPVLINACDTHVERSALNSREVNTTEFEFNSVFKAVYPTEILAILRLRDLIGLPNPTWIDHPLMQSPYAALTCRPGMLTERDELLQRFLMTAYQRDFQAVPPGLTAG